MQGTSAENLDSVLADFLGSGVSDVAV
jgi:hypothetical protein